MGLDERSVRRHLKTLEANALLTIKRRGLGKTNVYELNLTPRRL
jgi:DNA-binding transcriptional ArsR family regulator